MNICFFNEKSTIYKIHSVCSKPNLLLGKFNYYTTPKLSYKTIYYFYKMDEKYIYYFSIVFDSKSKKTYFDYSTILKNDLKRWFSECEDVKLF